MDIPKNLAGLLSLAQTDMATLTNLKDRRDQLSTLQTASMFLRTQPFDMSVEAETKLKKLIDDELRAAIIRTEASLDKTLKAIRKATDGNGKIA